MLVLPILGTALLGILMVDAFSTVFFPRGRGGPLSRRQNDLIWAFFRSTGRRPDGSTRDGWLSLAGPGMAVATLVVWMFGLVLGFALIYLPWMDSFLVSPGAARTPWWEALYYSGYTAATLGVGDLVPDRELIRLLAPLEAFGGFALVTAAVTYFLALYRELIQKRALAATIDGYFREGIDSVLDFVREGGAHDVARWADGVASRLAAVQLAHHQYPVLHYFRSGQVSRAMPVQLGCLLDLRRALRDASSEDRTRDLARHPSYRALRTSIEDYVREVSSLFIPEARMAQEESGPDADEVELAQREMLRFMLYDEPFEETRSR